MTDGLAVALAAWALVGGLLVVALLVRTGHLDGDAGDAPASVERGTVPQGLLGLECFGAFLLAPLVLAVAVAQLALGLVWMIASLFACNRFGHRAVVADGGLRCTYCTTWLVRPGGRS